MAKIKSERYKHVVIGMDHNLDFLKMTSHEGTANFITRLLHNSLFPCITRSTRVTNSSATLIDNIIVNQSSYLKQKSCVLISDISDHFPTVVIIDDVWPGKRRPKKVVSRDITCCKLTDLKTDLEYTDWSELLTNPNASSAYDCLMSTLSNKMDEHIPIIEKTIPVKQVLLEPWLTKGLRKCGKRQLKLYEKSLKSGNNNDLEKYKLYRSLLQKIKRNCKRDYYVNQCIKFKDNTKRLWQTINNITKK